MKKGILIFGVFFLFLIQSKAQDSTAVAITLTLQQCVEAAIKNNLDVRQSDYGAQRDKANWQLAKGSVLPFLSGDISHGRQGGRNLNPYTNSYNNQSSNFATYNINGSLNIFNGLNIQNTIRQYKLEYEAGKLDLQQQRDYVTINVILAYLSVLNNQDQLTLAKQQADVSRQQVDRLNILFKEGEGEPNAFYDLKGELATNELNIISTKNALESAKISLAQLMNVPYQEDIVLERIYDSTTQPQMYNGKVDDIYASAENNLAIVRAAQFHHLSALKGLQAAKGSLYPRLSLSGGAGTLYASTASLQNYVGTTDVKSPNYILVNGVRDSVFFPTDNFSSSKINYGDQLKNNFYSNFGITLSIPLLNGLQTRNRIKQARITADETAFVESTTKTQLKQSIEQAYVNNSTAFQRYETLEQQVSDFGESFRIAQIKFEAGVLTSVEFLVVKTNLDRSRVNLISARYDYILRSKILDYYQSKPLW